MQTSTFVLTHTYELNVSFFSDILKSGTFVSESQQSDNATWGALQPSEPKGKSDYNNIQCVVFHLWSKFCDRFNLSLIYVLIPCLGGCGQGKQPQELRSSR